MEEQHKLSTTNDSNQMSTGSKKKLSMARDGQTKLKKGTILGS
jgi:hypothetical protein